MKIISIVLLTIFLLGNSCENRKKEWFNKEKVQKLNYQFSVTDNKAYLDTAYRMINQNINKNTIIDNESDLDLIYPVYFYLEKYSELSKILLNSTNIDADSKVYSINLINAYNYYKNGNKVNGNKAISKNIELLNNKFKESTKDSILLMDLYIMKSYLYEVDLLKNELDSINKLNGYPSKEFIHQIIIEEIIDHKTSFQEKENSWSLPPSYKSN